MHTCIEAELVIAALFNFFKHITRGRNFQSEIYFTGWPKYQTENVCSCNIASLRAGEFPSSVREPQVTEAVTWGSLLKC